jgi:5-methylcytosine-specific restriction endonuclease McrA
MSLTRVPDDLRRLVRQRAKGSCEYCLAPEALSFALHQVDHIEAEKHGGLTTESNLALCCVICNQYKGTDLTSLDPLTRRRASLFNPRKHKVGAFPFRRLLHSTA